MLAALAEFQKLDKEMQAQTIQTFLIAALNEGLTQRELVTRTGYGPSTISRNIAALGEVHRNGTPGHNLLTARPDDADGRVKRIYLTPKGQEFLGVIQKRLNGVFT